MFVRAKARLPMRRIWFGLGPKLTHPMQNTNDAEEAVNRTWVVFQRVKTQDGLSGPNPPAHSALRQTFGCFGQFLSVRISLFNPPIWHSRFASQHRSAST